MSTQVARKSKSKSKFDFVSIEDLRKHPLFVNLPYKFLEYNARTVVRRVYEQYDPNREDNSKSIVCKEGDYGATAFLIIRGEFEIVVKTHAKVEIVDQEYSLPVDPEIEKRLAPNPWIVEAIQHYFPKAKSQPTAERKIPAAIPIVPIIRTKEDIIIGEMSCLSHHPRTATIRAVSDDCEMWEIRRNFLDALRRNKGSREILETMYNQRAIPDLLRQAELFVGLPEADRAAIVAYLLPRVKLKRVDPGQVVFEQGQPADHFYLIRIGYVKIARKASDGEFVLDYLGSNKQFGEIGLLTAASVDFLKEGVEKILPRGFARGTRTATVSALDDVELVQIQGSDFLHLAQTYPSFRDKVIDVAREYFLKNEQNLRSLEPESLAEAARIGFVNASSLLVIDLEKCTRCDECTKACADVHGGVSRLKRDGMRYGNYLVTTTCRSCQNPYCMVGCPVDAIHRRPPIDGREGLEIVIEDWCIGCGRCEKNCPYGNISMQDYVELESTTTDGPVRLKSYRPNLGVRVMLAALQVLALIHPRFQVKQKARPRAVTCDLCRNKCHSKTEEVACVHACPHDAAHRLSGQTLIQLVNQAQQF